MKNFDSYIPLFIPSFGSSITSLIGYGKDILLLLLLMLLLLLWLLLLLLLLLLLMFSGAELGANPFSSALCFLRGIPHDQLRSQLGLQLQQE